MNITNLNAIIRLVVSALLAVAGIGLLVYSAVLVAAAIGGGATVQAAAAAANSVFAIGSIMLAGSGLTAWDTHINPTPPASPEVPEVAPAAIP